MKFTYWALKNKKTGEFASVGNRPALYFNRNDARADKVGGETVVKVEAFLKAA